MPYRAYRPNCDCFGGAILTGSPECEKCGTALDFDSWRLSMHESMARYQVVYGLKPIGRHRKLADAVLRSKRVTCGKCEGAGIRTISLDLREPCSACEGTGGHWSCTPDAVSEARRGVLESYPEAAVSAVIRNFMGTPLAQSLKSGEMVELRDAEVAGEDTTPGYDDFVYGTGIDSLILIPRTIALELAQLWDALGSSITWGEFRSRVSEGRYREALDQLGDDGCDGFPPTDDADFPGYDLPGISDGDYPDWPAQLMLDWLPRDIIESGYARVEQSILNGRFLWLDPDGEAAIVTRLQELGYEVTQDRDLVLRACGQTS